MPGWQDAVTQFIAGVKGINNIASVLSSTFPRIGGSFTLTAATTTIVAQPATASNSIVLFTPTNSTAALTLRTSGLFHSGNTAGASFSVATQTSIAAGTETFEYVLVNLS